MERLAWHQESHTEAAAPYEEREWEEYLTHLGQTNAVTNLEAALLDIVMKQRHPMLPADIVLKADASEFLGAL
jgi:hypothetical protein